ncbi:MAG TPA: BppU family phage baseplate upper protein [Candidatus Tetragenococcus pullicola]|nr:BppU family phage baseplate upper protein [Candidatus Tetragenococcus pullicola]
MAEVKQEIILSTTEPNSFVDNIEIRQADEATQKLVVQLSENGARKSYTGLQAFFCGKIGQSDGLGIIEQKLTEEEMTDPEIGRLEYTFRAEDWQKVGRQIGYFSFRKMVDEHTFEEQFTTRDFYFTVTKNVFSEGLKEVKKDGSTYVWTIEDMVRLFKEYIASGKTDWEEFVEQNKDIIESIDPNGKLFTKLQENKENIDSRGINVLLLGLKNDGETDNYEILSNILNTLPDGSNLFFPAGKYLLSDNIPFRKQIHIEGIKPVYDKEDLVKGTIFRGGGLYFRRGSNGSTVKNVGVVNSNRPNGFDIREEIKDIVIDNCLTIARDHGYLIESYTGEVSNVAISNCQSFDGIHGFISKAKNTNIINCQANNQSSWGFGIISDNIPGLENIGAAINNKLSDCRAVKCGVGFSQYKRDYFGDSSEIQCVNNQFSNCSATECTVPLSLGDDVGNTGGGKYKSFSVDDTMIINFSESASTNPVKIYQTRNLTISGISLSQNMTLRKDANNTNPVIGQISGGKGGQLFDYIELDNGTSPSLKFGSLFRTNNSEKTEITSFKDGKDGVDYEINLWENNTIIKGSSTIFLVGPSISGHGSSIKFKCQDGIYFEISRGTPMRHFLNLNYTNATGIDISNYDFIDLYGTGTANNLIKINLPERSKSVITIFIRSSGGTFTFGGFDNSQFLYSKDLPKTVLWGTGLITQWAWLDAVGKYILISSMETKYA